MLLEEICKTLCLALVQSWSLPSGGFAMARYRSTVCTKSSAADAMPATIRVRSYENHDANLQQIRLWRQSTELQPIALQARPNETACAATGRLADSEISAGSKCYTARLHSAFLRTVHSALSRNEHRSPDTCMPHLRFETHWPTSHTCCAWGRTLQSSCRS